MQVLAGWGLGVASCSIAVLLGCWVNRPKAAIELAPLVFIPQLLFAGTYVCSADILIVVTTTFLQEFLFPHP